MPEPSPITIDLAEQFEHLPNAPIVEAVIQLVGRAEVALSSDELKAALKEALPEYPTVKSVGIVSVTLPVVPGEGPTAPAREPPKSERAWHGLRLETADALNVAVITRDYFSFSRLKPYQDWDTFRAEALRLWAIHKNVADPLEIRQIGVRFINRLGVPGDDVHAGEYFRELAQPPGRLPGAEFFYIDDLAVPGHPYRVRLVRTVQPFLPAPPQGVGLLLDIDVLCPQPIPPDPAKIQERLAQMHWIKNRVFFDNVTDKALELCR